jgi:hypothetical protein
MNTGSRISSLAPLAPNETRKAAAARLQFDRLIVALIQQQWLTLGERV